MTLSSPHTQWGVQHMRTSFFNNNMHSAANRTHETQCPRNKLRSHVVHLCVHIRNPFSPAMQFTSTHRTGVAGYHCRFATINMSIIHAAITVRVAICTFSLASVSRIWDFRPSACASVTSEIIGRLRSFRILHDCTVCICEMSIVSLVAGRIMLTLQIQPFRSCEKN